MFGELPIVCTYIFFWVIYVCFVFSLVRSAIIGVLHGSYSTAMSLNIGTGCILIFNQNDPYSERQSRGLYLIALFARKKCD